MKAIVLESAKGVKNGKVQLCFSQEVNTGNNPTNILGILNASDERFNVAKSRKAWLTAEPVDVEKNFGIDLSGLAEGEELTIDMVDPRIAGVDTPLNIQIMESTEGTEYDVANFETRAKRAGKDGDFIKTAGGDFIYTKTTVVVGEAKHTLITNTERVAATVSMNAIAEALS